MNVWVATEQLFAAAYAACFLGAVENAASKAQVTLKGATIKAFVRLKEDDQGGYHLLPELSAVENVMLPHMIRLKAFTYLKQRKAIRARATELLERVGLGHRLTHKPNELSGGEMQRAAIARALAGGPEILLADEPTGNLDSASGQSVLELLRDLNRERSLTMMMVTHDQSIAQQADRIVRLAEGRIEEWATANV